MSMVRQGMMIRRDPAGANPLSLAVRFGGMGVLILVLLKFIDLSAFFSVRNWQNIAFDAVPIGLIATGLALVMVAGAIDLSVAANFSLCMGVTGWLIANGHSAGMAIIIGLLIGVACGALNGALVGVLGLPAITVTLGSLAMVSGLTLAIGDGQPMMVNFFPSLFTGGFAIILALLMVLVAGALWLGLSITAFGASIADPTMRVGAGGPLDTLVRPALIPLFCCTGLLAAVAALVELGRLQESDPNIGSSSLITVIAAVVVGGAGLFRGGPLSILGAALGAVLVSIVSNELIIAGVTYSWVQFALGAIIAVSLLIDRMPAFAVV
jgi:ribose/xylose/arabinose/galactoside ABC-type transport system permease subunit